jgi:hypothetical protein
MSKGQRISFWLLAKPLNDLVSAALSVTEQFGHLRKIHRNPARLILAEQLGG